MKSKTQLFFDLDRTLWDFEQNSFEELMFLFEKYQLRERGIADPASFIKMYKEINENCWALYRVNKITKEELRGKRFYDALVYFGVDDKEMGENIGEDYIANCPYRTKLLPGAIPVLEYLSQKYEMHIITNGFEEVQHIKLRESGLTPFFDKIITSEQVDVKKPDPKIFNYALEQANCKAENAVYIGDDFHVDIDGAQKCGWTAIYFNPNNLTDNTSGAADIQNLNQLLELY
jgi:putative hydrolase of the HAD superfamily